MFAAIYVPCFSIQAITRHEPDLTSRPLALTDPGNLECADVSALWNGVPPWRDRTGEKRSRHGGIAALQIKVSANIFQANTAAEQCAVVPGLTQTQALARCRELILRTRSPSQEQSATEILLQTAFAFSPCIELIPGGCLLDLKGLPLDTEVARQKWCDQLRQLLESFHLTANLGIAATPDLALLAAQRAERVLIVEDAAAFVARLPISALAPAPEISEILSRWGIRRVGELLALGRDDVAVRLGPEILELFERVSPDRCRPLKLVSPPEIFSEHIEFENEIETIEPLLFILQRFVEQLSRRIEAAHLVIGELHLCLNLSSGQRLEHTFPIPDPTGRVPVLFRTLHTHLENVRADSPIVSLQLTAQPSAANPHQFGLFEATLKQPNQFAETLARLTALCGPDRVGSPVLEETHRPDAFQIRTPDWWSEAPDEPGSRGGSPHQCKQEGPALRRFRPAVPATIEFRGSRPALIRSRVLNGAAIEVRGPFHSSGDWWDDRRWAREEWDVQTAGGILCRVYRSSDGCFVEGVYD